MDIVIRDPMDSGRAAGAGVRFALRFINDARDVPFLKLMAVLSATVLPTGILLFLPGGFRWWLAAVHLGLVIYFLGPFVLMLHNTSHRRLFRAPWEWMNYFIPWVIGPFFGESPETYFAHHVGMHHPENNLEDDLSSTMPYERDRLTDFLRYFLRFFVAVLPELSGYFVRKRRRTLMLRCIAGELLFYSAVAALCFVDWRAALVVFVAPFVITRFGMMAGNWAQHAFLDETSPANNYRNSITCINSGYNRRCFNDGYHIGHHLRSTQHWTEMPGEFLKNLPTYQAEGAIVFTGIDYFGIWVCLMLRRYDWLARRVVQLGDTPRSTEEIVGILRSRTGWTRSTNAVRARAGAPRLPVPPLDAESHG